MSNRINHYHTKNTQITSNELRVCKVCCKRKSIHEFPVTNSYINKQGESKNWRKWTCRKCLRG